MIRTSERWPNLFIVGAPKAGTTAFYSYLAQHPEVFMSPVKEPRYFADDLDSGEERDVGHFVRSASVYSALFGDGRDHAWRGEASSLYLFSESAARRIAETCPEARIIIMLRDPVELVYAFHSQRVLNGHEDVPDFATALALEDERRSGARIPPRASIPMAFRYRDVGRLGLQVKRYMDSFPRSRIHTVVFEDLRADTATVFRRTLEFLGVDPSFRPDFTIENRGRRIRSHGLHRLANQRGGASRFARALVPRNLRAPLWRAVRRVNSQPGARPPLDTRVRDELRREFAPEVARLESLLGRDLANWR